MAEYRTIIEEIIIKPHISKQNVSKPPTAALSTDTAAGVLNPHTQARLLAHCLKIKTF